MILGSATGPSGRPLLIVGLSRVNIERLLAGEPILKDLDPVGRDGQLLVVFGETEESLAADLGAVARDAT